MRLVLLLALLVGAFLLMRGWLARQNPAGLRRMFWIIAAALLLLLLATRAGATLLYAFLPVLLPIALAMLRRQSARPSGGRPFGWVGGGSGPADNRPGGGRQQSQVVTRFLRMTLDHGSGELDGSVIDGRFRGQRLDDLSEAQLLELWRECRIDPRSQAVLEAWLDRHLGTDWREWGGKNHQENTAAHPPGGGDMDKAEAYAVLGLKPGATVEEIRAAHRRLMQRFHPDHGGSDYLAARINLAKDVLLGGH